MIRPIALVLGGQGAMRIIALMLSVLLFTGCATHYFKPNGTLEEYKTDRDACRHAGAGYSGAVLTGLGVVVWPLLLIGIPLLVSARESEKSCMHERGYSQEVS